MQLLPTILSFYTKNTGYETEASYLIASCKKLGLPFEIEGIDSLGNWRENCSYKPRFILSKLLLLQKPLLWIDADGMIIQKPELLKELKGDFAIPMSPQLPTHHPDYVYAGTLFFKPTPKTFKTLSHWVKACDESRSELIDQESLKQVILQNKAKAKIDILPPSYWSVYNTAERDLFKSEIVILQYQASRVLKIDGEESSLFDQKLQLEERTWRFFHRLSTLYQLGIHHAPPDR